MPQPRTYRSKVDAWLLAVLLAALALPLCLAFITGGGMWATLLVLPVAVLIAWLFQAIRYVIGDGVLRVHGGLYTLNIPLDTIHSVAPTRDPLASPALSLDRLEILYGEDKRVLVSPKDKTGFLHDIGFGGGA